MTTTKAAGSKAAKVTKKTSARAPAKQAASKRASSSGTNKAATGKAVTAKTAIATATSSRTAATKPVAKKTATKKIATPRASAAARTGASLSASNSASKTATKATSKTTGEATSKTATKVPVPTRSAATVTSRPLATGAASRSPGAVSGSASKSRKISPEQALANTRGLLDAKHQHDRQPQSWQALGPNQSHPGSDGFQSPGAMDKAEELHAAESRITPIQGSISTHDRHNQGKRDSR